MTEHHSYLLYLIIRKRVYIYIFMLAFSSCGIKTFYLEDSKTFKVPRNPRKYIKNIPFNDSLKNIINTNYIYEEFNEQLNLPSRLSKGESAKYYSVLRFYPNGCLNIFLLNKERESILTKNIFNPKYNGYRGFYNKINNQITFEKFVEINGLGELGKLSGTISIKNDTLFLYTKKNNETKVYIKRELNEQMLNYIGDW